MESKMVGLRSNNLVWNDLINKYIFGFVVIVEGLGWGWDCIYWQGYGYFFVINK